MHPLLAASFANAIVADRTGTARRRALRRGADTSGHAAVQHAASAEAGEVVIRRATPDDAVDLAYLGALDGNRAAGELLAYAAGVQAGAPADAERTRGVLVAEVDGEIEAAMALDGGLAVADPFRASALHTELLELRARQLGAEVTRRGAGHLRVLHPHTS